MIEMSKGDWYNIHSTRPNYRLTANFLASDILVQSGHFNRLRGTKTEATKRCEKVQVNIKRRENKIFEDEPKGVQAKRCVCALQTLSFSALN